jgi:hypothetical protein
MRRLRRCGREDFGETLPGEETPEMNSFLIEDEKGATGEHETPANLLPPPFFAFHAVPVPSLVYPLMSRWPSLNGSHLLIHA